MRVDRPQWPEPTAAGLLEEAAKWQERIDAIDVSCVAVRNERGLRVADRLAVQVALAALAPRSVFEASIELPIHADRDARAHLMRMFFSKQLEQIEKLGNPRWTVLVSEEMAR